MVSPFRLWCFEAPLRFPGPYFVLELFLKLEEKEGLTFEEDGPDGGGGGGSGEGGRPVSLLSMYSSLPRFSVNPSRYCSLEYFSSTIVVKLPSARIVPPVFDSVERMRASR